jgi:hypothetical protein
VLRPYYLPPDPASRTVYDPGVGCSATPGSRLVPMGAGKDNVVFLGRPAPARPTWPPGSRSAPARPGTGCCSRPPPNGSTGSPSSTRPDGSKTSSAATRCGHRRGRLHPLLAPGCEPVLPARLIPLRTRLLIVTSNKEFGRWGRGVRRRHRRRRDDRPTRSPRRRDRLKGDSYRLKNHDLGRIPTPTGERPLATSGGVHFQPSTRGHFSRR